MEDGRLWTVLVGGVPVTYEKLVERLGYAPVEADVVESVPGPFAASVVIALDRAKVPYELREETP